MSVLAYIQNFGGKLKKQNFQLASYAKSIADAQNTNVIAIILGQIDEQEIKKLGTYGISQVFTIQDARYNTRVNKAFTKIIEQLVLKENIDTIIFPDTNTGKAIGPRLSVRLKAGFVPGVAILPDSFNPFIIKKKVFTGKAFAQVEIKSEKRIISLAPNSFDMVENIVEMDVIPFEPTISETDFPVQLIEVHEKANGISLLDADIVVSGGRGMKSPENWKPLEELGNALGAAMACSRPVSDEGWRPHEEHVGQTGKIIAPNLYIAVGISGAIQHVGGVSGSKCMVAINNDSDAPIFEVADYGIIGDASKIIPELTMAIRKAKEE